MQQINQKSISGENQSESQDLKTRGVPPVIAPLLGKIEWDQGNPYNLDCPEEKGELTVTGCAATALAMVMKYYEYPQNGNGSYSYTNCNFKKIIFP